MHPGRLKKFRKKRHKTSPLAKSMAEKNRPGKRGKLIPQSRSEDSVGSGRKATSLPIPYGRVAGHIEGYTVTARNDMYIRLEPCECDRCSVARKEGWLKEDLGISDTAIIELISKPEWEFGYDFKPTGTAVVPRAKGLTAILRALQADIKGPWTKWPFWFNGRMVKLVDGKDWQIEKFDRLYRKEISLHRPIVKADSHDLSFDDKLGFEDRAQMNREFEKRFSS